MHRPNSFVRGLLRAHRFRENRPDACSESRRKKGRSASSSKRAGGLALGHEVEHLGEGHLVVLGAAEHHVRVQVRPGALQLPEAVRGLEHVQELPLPACEKKGVRPRRVCVVRCLRCLLLTHGRRRDDELGFSIRALRWFAHALRRAASRACVSSPPPTPYPPPRCICKRRSTSGVCRFRSRRACGRAPRRRWASTQGRCSS